jgi:hypothetical protein
MQDILTCDHIESICDNSYVRGKELPEGEIIHCAPEDIRDFFNKIKHTNRRIILVSSHSDCGLCYQEEYHPNKDIIKAAHSLDFGALGQAQKYAIMTLMTHNEEECNPFDKFSVKMDRFTFCTFNEIPPNIVFWWCVNNNVNESNVGFLPFGVNWQGDGHKLVGNYYKENKTRLLYVNFRVNSMERLYLNNYYATVAQEKRNFSWLTFRGENIDIEQYYHELSEHKYILGPNGNGMDCFKNYETLAVGSIPIISASRFAYNMRRAGFNNLIIVDNIYGVNNNIIAEFEKTSPKKPDLEILKKDYWTKKVKESRNLLK